MVSKIFWWIVLSEKRRRRFWLIVEASGTLSVKRKPRNQPVGDVHLDLAHQLALATNAKQIADQQGLEEQHGIQRGPTIIRTVKMTDALADKAEVEGGLNLTQQMVGGYEFFERDHLQFVLLGGRVFEHIGHH